jgi:hypothetical protein
MVGRFYEDLGRVPAGQITEVRFEDLECDPLGQLDRIYQELQIGGFAAVRPHIEGYVHSLAGYRKNRYTFEPHVIQRVEDQWGSALERWQYQRPG